MGGLAKGLNVSNLLGGGSYNYIESTAAYHFILGGDVPEFNDATIAAYLNPLFNNSVVEVHRVQELEKLRDAHLKRQDHVFKIEEVRREFWFFFFWSNLR